MSTLRRPATAFRGDRRLRRVAPAAEGQRLLIDGTTPGHAEEVAAITLPRPPRAFSDAGFASAADTPNAHAPGARRAIRGIGPKTPGRRVTAVDGAFLGVAAYRGCPRHAADGGVTALDTVAHRAVATDQRRPGRTPERCDATLDAVAGVAVVADRRHAGHAARRRRCRSRGRCRRRRRCTAAPSPATQPVGAMQLSTPLQALPSSQIGGAPGTQPVAGVAGLDAVAGVAVVAAAAVFQATQPVGATQVSTPLQALPSLQTGGVPATQPVAALQVSTPLQALPSLQMSGVPVYAARRRIAGSPRRCRRCRRCRRVAVPATQPLAGLQDSTPLQASPSVQTSGVPGTQPVAASQLSTPLQALPSLQMGGVPGSQRPVVQLRDLETVALVAVVARWQWPRDPADTRAWDCRFRCRCRRCRRHRRVPSPVDMPRLPGGRSRGRCTRCCRCRPPASRRRSRWPCCRSRRRCRRCRRRT